MPTTLPGILDTIVQHKRAEAIGTRSDLSALQHLALTKVPARRDFLGALRSCLPAVIAEVKKASPSRGVIDQNFDPVRTAQAYAAGGAAALSVLTDQRFFQGSLADLEAARAAVSIPVLRKDFTLDEFHVTEAAAHGADAILLIAAILSVKEMETLRRKAAEYGMAALVEVHDSDELQQAIDSGAEIIGVNNRDLRTFEIRTALSLELAPKIPKSVVKVSESGIHDNAQVKELMAAGFHAFLVGEHLMRSANPAAELMTLRGV